MNKVISTNNLIYACYVVKVEWSIYTCISRWEEMSSLDGGGCLIFYTVVYHKRAYRRYAQTKLGVFIMIIKDKD